LASPRVAAIEQLRQELVEAYPEAIKAINAGSWYEQLLTQPLPATIQLGVTERRFGGDPQAIASNLERQLKGKVSNWLEYTNSGRRHHMRVPGGSQAAKAQRKARR
jgi:hypothetical protein